MANVLIIYVQLVSLVNRADKEHNDQHHSCKFVPVSGLLSNFIIPQFLNSGDSDTKLAAKKICQWLSEKGKNW